MINFVDLSRLDTVPPGPGVYVWYVRPLIGKPDWQQSLNPIGSDTGDDSLRSVLFEFSKSMAPLEVKAEVQTAFRDGWTGQLKSTTYSNASQRLLNHGQESSFEFPGAQVDNVMASEKLRKLLTEKLEESFVSFWSPVYVGKSKTLRKRLSQHIAEFRQLHDITSANPEVRGHLEAELTNNPQSQPRLASRLIYAGFKPEQCRIGYLSTESENLADTEAENLAEVLEWLLNTWNRPLLGKN